MIRAGAPAPPPSLHPLEKKNPAAIRTKKLLHGRLGDNFSPGGGGGGGGGACAPFPPRIYAPRFVGWGGTTIYKQSIKHISKHILRIHNHNFCRAWGI